MGSVRPDIPRLDDTVDARDLHRLAEEIAVPCYNWVIMPMVAAIDGILRIKPDDDDPPRPLPRRRHPTRP